MHSVQPFASLTERQAGAAQSHRHACVLASLCRAATFCNVSGTLVKLVRHVNVTSEKNALVFTLGTACAALFLQ